jgi:hypothetical protein
MAIAIVTTHTLIHMGDLPRLGLGHQRARGDLVRNSKKDSQSSDFSRRLVDGPTKGIFRNKGEFELETRAFNEKGRIPGARTRPKPLLGWGE